MESKFILCKSRHYDLLRARKFTFLKHSLLKSYDCYVLILKIKKSLANLLIEKRVLLEVQKRYNCKTLSKLGC